ncbi:MAG: clostripain-related cysteine peptidase [Bacteroidales bacterium]
MSGNLLVKVILITILLGGGTNIIAESNIYSEIKLESNNSSSNRQEINKRETKPPHHLYAKVNNNIVNLNWFAPGEEPKLKNPEDFEAGFFPPAGWDLMKSTDLESPPIAIQENDKTWENTSKSPYNKKGKFAAFIKRDSKDCNWLVSPKITIEKDQKLSFDLYFVNNYYGTKFDVLILDKEKWIKVLSLDKKSKNNFYQERIDVDLKDYANKNIRVAFVYSYNNGLDLAIDNIKLTNVNSSIINPLREASEIKSYKIYRDDALIFTAKAEDRKYIDKLVPKGKHTYSVSAMYGETESSKTKEIIVHTIDAEIDLEHKGNYMGIDEKKEIKLKIKGFAENIKIDFGKDATPANEEGEGPYKVSYSSLGKKTITLNYNGIERKFINRLIVRPGEASVTRPQKISLNNSFQGVELNWRPNDITIYMQEGFEGRNFPPEGWQLKYSSNINSSVVSSPSGNLKWKANDKNDAIGANRSAVHWGNSSVITQPSFKGCQWLISPHYSIEENDELRFWLNYKNDKENGQVKHSRFHVMVKDNIEWKEVLYFGAGSENNNFEKEISISLDEFKGKDICVAFVAEESNGYQIAVDDIAIINQAKKGGKFKSLNVYRNDIIIETITEASITQFIDKSLSPQTNKYYVTIINKDDKESFPSNEIFAKSYGLNDLPYAQDFESSYDEISLSGKKNSWKIDNQTNHNNTTFSFPNNDGNYAAINCSEIDDKEVTDRLILPPVILDKYFNVFIEFDYVSDMQEFQLMGRNKINGKWELIENISPQSSWTHKKINLPSSLNYKAFQFSFFTTNSGVPKNGVALDNIKIGFVPGKKLVIEKNFEQYNHGESILLSNALVGQASTNNLYLTNIDSETINISNISVLGKGFSLKTPDAIIPLGSGERIPIQIMFTPTEEREYSGKIIIQNNSATPNFEVNIKANCGKAFWTYMLYIDEDRTGFDASEDLNQWEAVGSITGSVNYIALYNADDDTKDGIYYIQKDPEGMNLSFSSKRIDTEFNDNLNLNDPSTLTQFIKWAKANYPANHYGLNIWNHKENIFRRDRNWIQSNDRSQNKTKIKIWDIAKAIKEASNDDKVKLDIVGFDSSYFGQIETVYELKELTDIIIFSEKNIPNLGWDYTKTFEIINNNPKTDKYEIAKQFVDALKTSYALGGNQTVSKDGDEVCFSAIRTDNFKTEFITELNSFCEKTIKDLKKNKEEVKEVRKKSWKLNIPNHNNFVDFGDFLKQLTSADIISDEIKNNAQSLLTKYAKCIINTQENLTPKATGMMIWFPNEISKQNELPAYIINKQFLSISETKWDEFLLNYESPKEEGTPEPKPVFIGDKSIPINTIVQFMDVSSANPIKQTYKWIVDPKTIEYTNGTNENSAAPEICFKKAGKYTVKLIIKNSFGQKETEIKDGINVEKSNFNAPTNLFFNFNKTSKKVFLIWISPLIDETCQLSGYNIYRDGEKIASIADPKNKQFTETIIDNKNHQFYVTATYINPEGESTPSNTIEVFQQGVGLDELISAEINIYPNPNSGNFTINTKELIGAKLSILHISGKAILNKEIHSNLIKVNGLDSGVYLIKIASKNKLIIRKVVIR